MDDIFRRAILLIVGMALIGSFSTRVFAFTVQTGEKDGLVLDFTGEGAISGVITPKGNLTSSSPSGFFIRDVAAGKDINLRRTIQSQNNGTLLYKAYKPDPENNSNPVNINLEAIFTGHLERIEADIYIKNLTDSNRALTIYFALPINMRGWTWGDDIRISKPITGNAEIGNTVDVGFGSNGKISRYPIAAVYGNDGIAIGYRLDYPTVIRLTANPMTNQLKIVFDVALLPCTQPTCSGKHVLEHLKAVIYRFDPEWGFRSAIQKYYEIYPEFFVKRVIKEGIWVFHPRFLNHIPDIEDFGIAFHTTGLNSWSLLFEDKHNINSLRYLAEPWSHYREMPSSINWNTEQKGWDYKQVMEYLYSLYKTSPNKNEKEQAEATLSSGSYTIIRDATGNKNYKYNFFSIPKTKDNGELTWCPRCANFIHNSDPDIKDPTYHLNNAHYVWNDNTKSIYQNTATGVLDGEFIDTIESWFPNFNLNLDYRESHIAASDLPLTYDSNLLPAVPITFATYEFSRWVRTDILNRNKLMMSNGLRMFAFFAHLFDVMGIEVEDWLFRPDKDSDLNFWRTMSYQKPFTFLIYDPKFTHDDKVRRPVVERYFKTSLFYGIYPGPANDTFKKQYFDDVMMYEKDRDLFKKYIPLIQALGAAGWQPVTYVKSSNPRIYVERYGPKSSTSNCYITIRNISSERQTYSLTLMVEPLGLTNVLSMDFIDLITGDTVTATKTDEAYLTLKDTIEANEVRMFARKKDVCTDNDYDGFCN